MSPGCLSFDHLFRFLSILGAGHLDRMLTYPVLHGEPGVVHVVGGFFEQYPEVIVGERVEDPSAIPPALDHPQIPEDAQLVAGSLIFTAFASSPVESSPASKRASRALRRVGLERAPIRAAIRSSTPLISPSPSASRGSKGRASGRDSPRRGMNSFYAGSDTASSSDQKYSAS